MRIKTEEGKIKFSDDEDKDITSLIDARSVDIRVRPDDVVTATVETFSHGIDVGVLKENAKVFVGASPFADDIAEEIVKELEEHSEACVIYEGEGYEGNRAYIKGLISGTIRRESVKER